MNRDDANIEQKLSAYLDGALPPEEMRLVEEYLKTHPDAARELERMRKLDHMTRQPDPAFSEELLNSIEENVMGRISGGAEVTDISAEKKSGPLLNWYRVAAIAASVIFVFIVGRMALKDSEVPMTPPQQKSELRQAEEDRTVPENETSEEARPSQTMPSLGAEQSESAKQETRSDRDAVESTGEPAKEQQTGEAQGKQAGEAAQEIPREKEEIAVPEAVQAAPEEQSAEPILQRSETPAKLPEGKTAAISEETTPTDLGKSVEVRSKTLDYLGNTRKSLSADESKRDESIEVLRGRLDSLNQAIPQLSEPDLVTGIGEKVRVLSKLVSFPEGGVYRNDLALSVDSLDNMLGRLSASERERFDNTDYKELIARCRAMLKSPGKR